MTAPSSDHQDEPHPTANSTRSQLDQLLTESRLYKEGKDYRDLLNFVVRLRNFAPFNAMLLQVQKPGLSYAATARDWWGRFGRRPKDAARPLLILWPFGPVALVYDVLDTEGDDLPEDVASFVARGPIDEAKMKAFERLLQIRGVECRWVDQGDRNAGLIQLVSRFGQFGESGRYCIHINRNHDRPVQFATLAHELGHLCLGHLGPDKAMKVPERPSLSHGDRELEAESVTYIVCGRHGVRSKSERYLSNFVDAGTTIDRLDVYQVMRAAGQVEALLGLGAHGK